MVVNEYAVCDMNDWNEVSADLIITDPPFGINFDGMKNNYDRNKDNITEGYIEWEENEYEERINELLSVISRNLKKNGQALIFSGWNNSYVIHNSLVENEDLTLRGKMYWFYNFAPYCSKRPAHNCYEIFWATKSNEWYYNNECRRSHCQYGESNLSSIEVKRDFSGRVKYPTKLPLEVAQILLDHFSKKEHLVFDPLAGSGVVGIAASTMGRMFVLGDLNPNAKEVYEQREEFYFTTRHEENFEEWL